MSWWCSALLGLPWTWTWRAYPGVWLFVLVIVGGYLLALARLEPGRLAGGDRRTAAREILFFLSGAGLLWAGADWPIGTLAAGYLLSARTIQYLLFAYLAPALMLMGLPRWLLRRGLRNRAAFRVARALARPLLPLAIANAVLVGVHLPVVIDRLSASQAWTFALDVAVMASGFVFWWPALARLPEVSPMAYGARIGYLGLNLLLPTVPASFYTFSQYPIYSLYELAPRVANVTALEDQRVAGLLMKVLGGSILLGTISVMFFRWHAREAGAESDAVTAPSSG